VVARIAAEDAAFFIEPARYPQDAALADMGADPGEICVPLRRRERLIGWLLVSQRRSERPYTPDDLDFLSALADQSALAVENARLFAQMTQKLTQMGASTSI
jgi:GAF domain-containing protein